MIVLPLEVRDQFSREDRQTGDPPRSADTAPSQHAAPLRRSIPETQNARSAQQAATGYF
jgi:hypothetical protein